MSTSTPAPSQKPRGYASAFVDVAIRAAGEIAGASVIAAIALAAVWSASPAVRRRALVPLAAMDVALPEIAIEAPAEQADRSEPRTLEEQRRRLFSRMREELALGDAAMAEVEAIFAASPILGQGNPMLSWHPVSRAQCRARRAAAGLDDGRAAGCGAPWMAPLYDPAKGQRAEDARVCIDRFEFPGIACEYPVVHVRAREAALLCRAVGKRICDAHEWEGACAGALHEAETEYAWQWPRAESSKSHNILREIVWSSESARQPGTCAVEGSMRTPGCVGGYERCGSNTFPAGAFPECRSALGVFDLHGNAAEHMNVPARREELASSGGELGFTEMKGSWFAFGQSHPDDCRWREPGWHETRVMSDRSHHNYHLGFRCCKDAGK